MGDSARTQRPNRAAVAPPPPAPAPQQQQQPQQPRQQAPPVGQQRYMPRPATQWRDGRDDGDDRNNWWWRRRRHDRDDFDRSRWPAWWWPFYQSQYTYTTPYVVTPTYYPSPVQVPPAAPLYACPVQRPTVCTAEYDPVCASNGQTFGNACTACANPAVAHYSEGACSLSWPGTVWY